MNPGSAHAEAFINNLTHTKGPFAGRPFDLRRWQSTRIIRPLYHRERDGRRRYRTALLMLPRKNGKTELAAAMVLYALLADGEIGGEVYSAAADRDQASLVFHVVAGMIRNDPELAAQCEIVDSQRRIVHRASGSVYRAISAEAYSKHGFNASFVVYDELHAAPNRELWDVLATSQGGRANPLMVAISTAGHDRHSILWELYTYAHRVAADPTLDPSFLPVIFEAPKAADWLDERVWRRANPALGDFRSLDEMRIMAKRAREIPAQENAFRNLYLNQWTEQAERWIQMAAWDACVSPRAPAPGAGCYAGLDLATTTDLAAAVLVFPEPDGTVIVRPHFWIPKDNLAQRVRRDRVPYDQWEAAGLITVTPGASIEYAAIHAAFHRWAETYQIKEIGYDPWNAEETRQKLEADGFTLTKVPQTFAGLNEGTRRLTDRVLDRTLVHDGHPVLRWHAGNMVVRLDPSGNLRPDKAASTEKIDGMVALIMALAVWLRQPRAVPPTYRVLVLGGAPA